MKKFKLLILFMLSLTLLGAAYFFINGLDNNDRTHLMADFAAEADESMQNYYQETDLPVYKGEYFEVKVKEAFVYTKENGFRLYVYNLLIAPIYNQKTVIYSFKLSSLEYGKKFEKMYYDHNHTFEKVNKDNYTYRTAGEILCNQYQFFLYDNSLLYGYEITEEQLNSCYTNILLTININGYKDKIELKDIQISEFTEDNLNNSIIKNLLTEDTLSASMHAYVSEFNEDLK